MKLKVLPPTLRKNNRYLTIDIKIQNKISKNDLVAIVWDSCIRYWGECNTSNFNLWVMRLFDYGQEEDYYNYKAIVRCQRGYEDQVRAAFCVMKKFNKNKIAINTIGSSGTIKASMDRYIQS